MRKEFAILKIENGIVQDTWKVKELLTRPDGRYIVEISTYNKRSNPQNRYYWGLVIPLIQKGIEEMGTELTKEETHEFLKARFNSSDLVNEETGETISIPKSTTGLSKEKFAEYIAKIQQFGSEFLNILIPDPGVQTELSYD